MVAKPGEMTLGSLSHTRTRKTRYRQYIPEVLPHEIYERKRKGDPFMSIRWNMLDNRTSAIYSWTTDRHPSTNLQYSNMHQPTLSCHSEQPVPPSTTSTHIDRWSGPLAASKAMLSIIRKLTDPSHPKPHLDKLNKQLEETHQRVLYLQQTQSNFFQ